MKAIYKYRVGVAHNIHAGFRPRHVAIQNGIPCVWVEVDTDKPKLEYVIDFFPTGAEIPDGWDYLGTFFSDAQGTYVWHVHSKVVEHG